MLFLLCMGVYCLYAYIYGEIFSLHLWICVVGLILRNAEPFQLSQSSSKTRAPNTHKTANTNTLLSNLFLRHSANETQNHQTQRQCGNVARIPSPVA